MTHIVNGIECRTREESLKHIIAQAKAEKIGPAETDKGLTCAYQYRSGNHCAVGSLFSEAQLKDINFRGWNEMRIGMLATGSYVGKKNIETVTGMTLFELSSIQSLHDREVPYGAERAREKVIAYCEGQLRKMVSEAAAQV